jgi:hypothetical protein
LLQIKSPRTFCDLWCGATDHRCRPRCWWGFVTDRVYCDLLVTLQFSLVPIGSWLVGPVELGGWGIQSHSDRIWTERGRSIDQIRFFRN